MSKKAVAPTRKQITDALWARGTLEWKLKPSQVPVYELYKDKENIPNQLFLFNLTRRFGKTFILGILAVEYALAHPNSTILMCASEQKQIAAALEPTFITIFEDCPEHLRPKWKSQFNIFKFKNGSQIQFAGMDAGRIEQRRGLTAHLIIVDEAGFCTDLKSSIQSVLFPMTATTKGNLILSSSSPTSPAHEFITIFKERAIQAGTFIKKTIYEADFTPEEIVIFATNSGGLDSSDFKREYLCEVTIDTNMAIIPEFVTMAPTIVKEMQKPPFYNPCVVLDLGFKDFTGVLFSYYDFQAGKIVIEDELLFVRQNSTTITQLCKKKEQVLYGMHDNLIRICDGPMFTLNDMATIHGYATMPPKKPELEEQVNKLRQEISSGRVIINPRCVNLIHQLESGVWSSNRTKFARSEAEGHNDLIACAQYLVRHIDIYSNPFPRGYGFDPHHSRIKEQENNPSIRNLRNIFFRKQ